MRGAKRIIGVDLNPDKFEIGMPLDNCPCILGPGPPGTPELRTLASLCCVVLFCRKEAGVTDFINPNDTGEKTVTEV